MKIEKFNSEKVPAENLKVTFCACVPRSRRLRRSAPVALVLWPGRILHPILQADVFDGWVLPLKWI